MLAQLGLHVGQEMFLLRLWDIEGIPQSDLAKELCVQPATITKMIDRMVKTGLVERRKDNADQRISRIYLTEHAKSLQPAVQKVWTAMESKMLESLSLEERVLFRRLLMQVKNNLTS